MYQQQQQQQKRVDFSILGFCVCFQFHIEKH